MRNHIDSAAIAIVGEVQRTVLTPIHENPWVRVRSQSGWLTGRVSEDEDKSKHMRRTKFAQRCERRFAHFLPLSVA